MELGGGAERCGTWSTALVNLTYSQTDILDGIITLGEQCSNREERSDPDVVAGGGPEVK